MGKNKLVKNPEYDRYMIDLPVILENNGNLKKSVFSLYDVKMALDLNIKAGPKNNCVAYSQFIFYIYTLLEQILFNISQTKKEGMEFCCNPQNALDAPHLPLNVPFLGICSATFKKVIKRSLRSQLSAIV